MRGSAAACAMVAALMGTYAEVWQWVCSGVVYGTLGTCLIQMPQAAILSNWFFRKTGLALGVSTAVGSHGVGNFGSFGSRLVGLSFDVTRSFAPAYQSWRTRWAASFAFS